MDRYAARNEILYPLLIRMAVQARGARQKDNDNQPRARGQPDIKGSALGWFSPRSALAAVAWYAVSTVVMTWPLVAGIARDIPWDLGDSLLNCWILGWDADHLARFLGGDLGAFHGFWTANIFYPAPLTLAYSEHLFVQALQILPVYALTHNLVLCYNLLFLSTFVLSAFGAYLLVREVTGSWRAAFVAGLIYGFTPYRIGQFSHLQVLSSQWMPLALFGLHRYFHTRTRRALAWAAVALVAQNLSCGYFLVYFAPFVAAYVLYEVATRRLWTDWAMWGDLLIAASGVLALTWPFVVPYLELRALGFPPRPIDEVARFSADVYSYLTAHRAERLYGTFVRAYPKPEGDLFPAITPVLLAVIGLGLQGVGLWRAKGGGGDRQGVSRPLMTLVAAVAVLQAAAALVIILTGGVLVSLGPFPLRLQNLWRVARQLVVTLVVLACLSGRMRQFLGRWLRSPAVFYTAATIAACWLSLGPAPETAGRRLVGAGGYHYLYHYIPGFDGLRAPARLAMLVMLFLSVVAGFGAAEIERRWKRGAMLVLVTGVIFLIEATAAPLVLNGTFASGDYLLPARIMPAARAPEVYHAVEALPPDAVIAEFPFGDDPYELRHMFYSTVHRRRLINGYSGGFPPAYMRIRAALRDPLRRPNVAWTTLVQSGATHAIVHEAAYRGRDAGGINTWLRRHGARSLGTFGRDTLFAIPAR